MKSNYKRIGDFIQLVDKRNTDLKVETLLKDYYSGSAVPTLNRNDIHALYSPKPPRELIENFDSILKNIFKFIDKTVMQINHLTSFNDILLSKMAKV